MHWQRRTNEVALMSMQAYCDLPLPHTFDVIFDTQHPDKAMHIPFTITQAILNAWMPVRHIAGGQKHILILEFEHSTPDILYLLSPFITLVTTDTPAQIGLCANQHFTAIKSKVDIALAYQVAIRAEAVAKAELRTRGLAT